jgi:hypothetical protein
MMVSFSVFRRVAVVSFLAAAALSVAAATPTRAFVISDSPTLPLLDVPYVSSGGEHCFPAAGVCVNPGILTLTLPSSSIFDLDGQHITSGAQSSAVLTDLSHAPIGTVALSGTVEQEVLGRTSATETGDWPTELLSLLLNGSVLGHTLTVTLDPSFQSAGGASIDPIAGERYRIDSFFDVFVELSLDTPIPLTAELGPIHVEAVQRVPEPSSIALIAIGLLMVAGAGIRQRAALTQGHD